MNACRDSSEEVHNTLCLQHPASGTQMSVLVRIEHWFWTWEEWEVVKRRNVRQGRLRIEHKFVRRCGEKLAERYQTDCSGLANLAEYLQSSMNEHIDLQFWSGVQCASALTIVVRVHLVT